MAIVVITIVLFMVLGEAALLVPVFAAGICFQVYRVMLYREMHSSRR